MITPSRGRWDAIFLPRQSFDLLRTLGPTTLKLPLQTSLSSLPQLPHCLNLGRHFRRLSPIITIITIKHIRVAGTLLLPNQRANGGYSGLRAQASGLLRPCTRTTHAQRPRHHPVLSHQTHPEHHMQGVDSGPRQPERAYPTMLQCARSPKRWSWSNNKAEHCLGKWTARSLVGTPTETL